MIIRLPPVMPVPDDTKAKSSKAKSGPDPLPDARPCSSNDPDQKDTDNKPSEGQSPPKAPVPTSKSTSSFGLHRHYRAVDIDPDALVLSPEKLDNPPSLQDGMSIELERELRYLGCELIQSATILLKLPQVAAATGQILYQRYFQQKSFVRSNFEHVAMACLATASKIEESPRRPRDVINVFHHLKQLSKCKGNPDKRPHPLAVDANYTLLKNQVIKSERRVLNVLGFCVHVKHPHKLITSYMKALQCHADTDMLQKAWNYMNDGLRTDMFLRYPVPTVACACIHLAARCKQLPLPMAPHPWWQLFDATDAHVHAIAVLLLTMYKRTKSPSWSRIDREMSELKAAYEARQRPAVPVSVLNAVQDNTQNGHKANTSPRRDDKRRRSRSRSASPRRDRSRRDRSRDDRRRNKSLSRSPIRSRNHNKEVSKRYAKYGPLIKERSSHRGERKDKEKRHKDRDSSRKGDKESRRAGLENEPRLNGDKDRDKSPSDSPPASAVSKRSPKDTSARAKQKEKEVKKELGKRRRHTPSPIIMSDKRKRS